MKESVLIAIERRLDAFGEWFVRVVNEGGPYDRRSAMEDYRLLEQDMKLLIETVRTRMVNYEANA